MSTVEACRPKPDLAHVHPGGGPQITSLAARGLGRCLGVYGFQPVPSKGLDAQDLTQRVVGMRVRPLPAAGNSVVSLENPDGHVRRVGRA